MLKTPNVSFTVTLPYNIYSIMQNIAEVYSLKSNSKAIQLMIMKANAHQKQIEDEQKQKIENIIKEKGEEAANKMYVEKRLKEMKEAKVEK